ncbi:MAG: AMP-binding protein [Vicinamibacterales bacterium]|mgnify:CR=1 FL=1|nr:AMP-binding protein [Acidobacteriota bacterium]MDP6372167.1 AMP-binding protein [Vicinamibacterales bacterium]MDP6607528.1 AMP-binding protein [Vicinamibacterales bacterium]HAK53897.1 AMP-binding protein [Acidobacteriota bacterium]
MAQTDPFHPVRDLPVGALLTHLARALPDREALAYPAVRYTFAELEGEARLVARGLMAVGIEPGERVALWATNVPEWVVLQFALAKIGAVLVTVNTSFRAKELDYLLRQCRARTVATIRGLKEIDYLAELRMVGALPGETTSGSTGLEVERVIGIADAAVDEPALVPYARLRTLAETVTDAALDTRSAAVAVDDVTNMQYTSGTTGFPKGVMLSSRNIVNNGYALGDALALSPADRLALCVPLFHCFGCVIGVLGMFTHGGCLCPVERFEPQAVLDTVVRERCTVLHGVPTMFRAMLEVPEFSRYDVTSLRTGIMAGAPCPEPLMRRVIGEMHLPEMTIAYGLTEASPGITITGRDDSIARRTQTVGRALPEVEVRIVDPATQRPVATGVRGELQTRGYHVMKGYYDKPEATVGALDADGWLSTGDQAEVDADGYVRVTGRIKDLIISGGENIDPSEIEVCLRAHPEVADAYAYGVADERWGERVAASVRLHPGASVTAEALTESCRGQLASFKLPRVIRIVEEYPMTASGKVQKFKLRELHEQELADAGS